jgi:hypothetical protein
MSDVKIIRDEVQNRTDGVIACIPEAIRQLKERKGIKDPVKPPALFKNRYDQPTPYFDDGSDDPIESQAPLIQVTAACGNLEYHGHWVCKGCGLPEGRCRFCLMRSVRRRYDQLHGSGWKTVLLQPARKVSRRTMLYKSSKPIVLEHCDSRPIICRNEAQVNWEINQRGFHCHRGPGQDA